MAGNEISARIKIDGGDEAVKALQNVGKEAKKIDGTTAEAKVKADTKAAEKGLKEVSSDLKKVDGETATAKVKADTGSVKGDLDAVFDIVEKLGRRRRASSCRTTLRPSRVRSLTLCSGWTGWKTRTRSRSRWIRSMSWKGSSARSTKVSELGTRRDRHQDRCRQGQHR